MADLKIIKNRNGQFRFKVRGDNHENLSTSEQYTQKHNATEGFDALAVAVIKILLQQGKLSHALKAAGLLDEAYKTP